MKIHHPLFVSLPLFLLTGSKAFADETSSGPLPASPTPSVLLVAAETPNESFRVEVPVRPLLSHFAHQEALQRYGEGVVGVAGAGVLVGGAIVAGPYDRTWSYALGITGGVVALGSIARLLIPSELESLQQSARNLSEQELRARWGELARARRLERRVGAVLESLLGATSVVLGALVLDRELGNLDVDPRRALGSALVASGALGVVQGGVHWFVPSPIEVGYGLVETRPTFAFGAAPTASGFSVAVMGAF